MKGSTLDFPRGPFSAEVRLPGDKSLGHRALILASMARGESRVEGLSTGADIASTRHALQEVGVSIDGPAMASPGIEEWSAPKHALDCGNSGTTMRLLAGALAGSAITATLVGDASLSARPMRRLVEPLGALGASVRVTDAGTAPITVTGTDLHGAEVTLPVASAQLRTAVALAALNASGDTHIDSPPGYRDHTERWLSTLGLAERRGATALVVNPGPVPPFDVAIPGDPSSAAFLWAAAATRPDSRISTPGISLNPGRLGFLRVLAAMGAEVTIERQGAILGDPVGDVVVCGGALRGTVVEGADAVAALDELPLVAVVAAIAQGETVVRDAGELRVKESDRIGGALDLVAAVGRAARETADGFVVTQEPATPAPRIDTRGDHRIAMGAAVAAVAAGAPVEVLGFDAAAVSWPEFPDVMESLWS